MAIELTDHDGPPSVEFDKVFVLLKEVTQAKIETVGDSPKFQLIVQYQMYGIDAEGRFHYKPRIYEIIKKDFVDFATKKAVQGTLAYVQAFAADEIAIAALIAEDRGTQATVI